MVMEIDLIGNVIANANAINPEGDLQVSEVLGYLHYVRFSQFYWHFCKSIMFAFLYPKSYPVLALNTGILVPYFAYDLPEFKIRPWDHIGSYNTHLKHGAFVHYEICPKMSEKSWKSYIVGSLGFEMLWRNGFKRQFEQGFSSFLPHFCHIWCFFNLETLKKHQLWEKKLTHFLDDAGYPLTYH